MKLSKLSYNLNLSTLEFESDRTIAFDKTGED